MSIDHKNIVVIKYGGSTLSKDDSIKNISEDICYLKSKGMYPVIVHGGGPYINEEMKKSGKESLFIKGLRVTDKDTVDIVKKVLIGKVNKDIVSEINKFKGNAIGISGIDGDLIEVSKKHMDNVDLGFVGKIEKINKGILEILIKSGYIPVIAPLGVDEKKDPYNVNADYGATHIASALGAHTLIFLTDVAGILRDSNDESTLIEKIEINEVDDYIDKGIIRGGMIPKIKCCAEGIKHNVKRVYITNGKKKNSVRDLFFNEKVKRTVVV
ncbi:MAG: acetylglutamate kinase [Anaeromicrobium sp.]|jgi:acetylglutamate kinase|uniref:acetylglutamate kinase n=1 Tax=Anaeromicrobium sp. TaxID=1929132 RepID=UPI0025F3B116|nr:acetylglutamate kinase [Anaeromicrobium sp.]MCT4596011.1 acetylglutamate kinase [Anaeromicrobium sp.]